MLFYNRHNTTISKNEGGRDVAQAQAPANIHNQPPSS